MKTLLLIVPIILLSIAAKPNSFQWEDTTVVELITFESPSVYFIQSTPTTNCWQIGEPSKSDFSEAYSGANAIVTDTLNPYPINNHSWFDLRIDLNDYYWFINLGIGFYHKIQTESNTDGGYITVSYDKGATWNNIINDSVCPFMFSPSNPCLPNVSLYSSNDSLFNGEPGFSGTVGEWQYVEFYWYMRMVTKSPGEVDTLLIRFNFVSDASANEMDGWMIDDIRLFYNHFNGGISGSEIDNVFLIYPNPTTDQTIIRTKTQRIISKAELFTMNGRLIREEIVQNTEYLFNKGTLAHGVYFIRCSFNDSSTQTLKIVVEN